MVMQLDVFQVLADPTRRRIVEVLRAGEQPVGDVVEKAGVHQSGVSRHLRILSESGFVSMRPDGQRRLYALKPDPFRELEEWVTRYRGLWEARLDRFGAALEARHRRARRARKTSKRT
jgi:DNA-binding transcriptional ArsR family regulator